MKSSARDFSDNAEKALLNPDLRRALAQVREGFVVKRAKAFAELPEFAALRRLGHEIKQHSLEHLDYYLERYERQVIAAGGQVHWAQTPQQARDIVVKICRDSAAQRVIKGKSMVSEEVALNEALEAADFEVTETDLGEYIIQLAKEPPSHIIAPAVHKTREQVNALFRDHHKNLGGKRDASVAGLVNEARQVLRQAFLKADVGITGANFLIAETGAHVLVTNEGNGDLCSSLPRVHIVTASIEKVIPNLEDLSVLLRLLARSATGQPLSVYTTLYNGPAKAEQGAGPKEYHVVLVDHGRSTLLGTEFREALRCIRCGACLNHCPVYTAIGGHAYGWVYPGPIGAVLSPLMLGMQEAHDLPHACTLNGHCQQVCPMEIPLPSLLRRLRQRGFSDRVDGRRSRWALQVWVILARHPALYRFINDVGAWMMGKVARGGVLHRWPMAGAWTRYRDLPTPEGSGFISAWKRGDRS
ncbi:MAG TPA: iron-sulfur cluster-binding protein [Gammaproteobacteria bacterium]|nr:iron-sulfur cluster-binding protein [Gammaproteobacteria bacterium]